MLASKIQLEILGMAFSQIQAGAYALVLGEVGGLRRISIIIGQAEAQIIGLYLQGGRAPRPLIHDVMYGVLRDFNISLREVQIYGFEKEVHHAYLVCRHAADDEKYIDARTSDAIALAVRVGCPIYIDADIFVRNSVVFKPENAEDNKNVLFVDMLEYESLENLQKQLQEAVKQENYEQAAKIRDEINRRVKN
ncbi:MAG: bifunctional nuclease family protein [Prevotellaceae bacterium]|jgi:bifunctional DNase/RNase|nr:bifunctional nuclease family protein [Prevotellaceae bacterium]